MTSRRRKRWAAGLGPPHALELTVALIWKELPAELPDTRIPLMLTELTLAPEHAIKLSSAAMRGLALTAGARAPRDTFCSSKTTFTVAFGGGTYVGDAVAAADGDTPGSSAVSDAPAVDAGDRDDDAERVAVDETLTGAPTDSVAVAVPEPVSVPLMVALALAPVESDAVADPLVEAPDESEAVEVAVPLSGAEDEGVGVKLGEEPNVRDTVPEPVDDCVPLTDADTPIVSDDVKVAVIDDVLDTIIVVAEADAVELTDGDSLSDADELPALDGDEEDDISKVLGDTLGVAVVVMLNDSVIDGEKDALAEEDAVTLPDIVSLKEEDALTEELAIRDAERLFDAEEL